MKNEPHKIFFILVFKIRIIYYCSGKNNVLLIYQHFSEYSKYGSQFQIDFIWLYACKSSNAWLQNLLYYTLFFNDPNLEKKRLHAVDMLIDYNILSRSKIFLIFYCRWTLGLCSAIVLSHGPVFWSYS